MLSYFIGRRTAVSAKSFGRVNHGTSSEHHWTRECKSHDFMLNLSRSLGLLQTPRSVDVKYDASRTSKFHSKYCCIQPEKFQVTSRDHAGSLQRLEQGTCVCSRQLFVHATSELSEATNLASSLEHCRTQPHMLSPSPSLNPQVQTASAL